VDAYFSKLGKISKRPQKKINTLNQPISIEEITNVRQESARQNIKKT
jgi:hypothetical protein